MFYPFPSSISPFAVGYTGARARVNADFMSHMRHFQGMKSDFFSPAEFFLQPPCNLKIICYNCFISLFVPMSLESLYQLTF